jgi:hypothetical protein
MLKSVLAFIVVLSLVGMALADDVDSANYVMRGCRDNFNLSPNGHDFLLAGRCAGIIEGIVFMGDVSHDFCVPETATHDQMIRVVVANIDKHPERMHLHFALLARTTQTAV